jgi:hypothetical protein
VMAFKVRFTHLMRPSLTACFTNDIRWSNFFASQRLSLFPSHGAVLANRRPARSVRRCHKPYHLRVQFLVCSSRGSDVSRICRNLTRRENSLLHTPWEPGIRRCLTTCRHCTEGSHLKTVLIRLERNRQTAFCWTLCLPLYMSSGAWKEGIR